MSKLEDSIKKNALNEDAMLAKIREEVFETSDTPQVFEKSNAQVFEKSNAQVFEKSNAQVFEHTNQQVFERTSTQVFEKSNTKVFEKSSRRAPVARYISMIAAAVVLVLVGSVAAVMLSKPAAPTNPAGSSTVISNTAATAETAESFAQIESTSHGQAFTMIGVDINPSFEIFVDEAGMVISIEAKNDDAMTMDTSVLVGLPAQDAVAGLIDLAEAAGFIHTEDDADDYVLIFTVLLEEEDEENKAKQETLGQLIRERVEAAGELEGTTKVAIIKATQVELFEARGKDVPMGLYIINGMIENNGEMIPVSEFVKDANNLRQLEKRAEIAAGKGDKANNGNNGNGPQSTNANPNSTKPNETGPNETAPGQTAPGQTAPNETAPGQTGTTNDTNPGDTAPGKETKETTPDTGTTTPTEPKGTQPSTPDSTNSGKGGQKNG